jgi:hypothetical protein
MRVAGSQCHADVEMYYERVIHLLEDGKWHEVAELRKVTAYPTLWLEELRREGYEVAERPDGQLQVRARHDDRELAAVA